MIPTSFDYNTTSQFCNISRTSWNWHFTKSMSSEEEGEEVNGGTGCDRGLVGDDSLACMTSYFELRNEDQKAFKNFMRMPPEMFDELLTRVGPRISKQNTNYREALEPGLKLAVNLRHLASGTMYRSMSYGWRVPHNTIALFIPEVCQAIIDEYKDEVMKCPSTPDGWCAVADKFMERWSFPHTCGAIDGKHVNCKCSPVQTAVPCHSLAVRCCTHSMPCMR